MRKTCLGFLVVGAVLAVCLSVQAQFPPPGAPSGQRDFRGGPPGQIPGGPPPSPILEALDTNGDGELSTDEISKAPEALKKLDKNSDGKLTQDELRPQFDRGPGGPGGPSGQNAAGGPDRPGDAPRGPGRFGGPGGNRGPRQASSELNTVAKDDAERKAVQAIDEIAKTQGWQANVPVQDGRMLRILVESTGAKSVVEFGTSNGISAIWMAIALQKSGGKLVTHEINPEAAAQARKNFALAGVADTITVVEGDGHEKAKALKGPIDLVFIDADKGGYTDYYQKVLPLVRPGGLIVAHNMNPQATNQPLVKTITTSPDVDTVFYQEGGGMSISVKKR